MVFMKRLLTCAIVAMGFLLLESQALYAQNDYAVSKIPENLTMGADAVMRVNDVEFIVKSEKKGVKKVRYAVTVLNAKAKNHARIGVGYDNLRKLSYLKARLYDANGKEIRKLKASDIHDRSTYDGFSIASDNRVKVADLRHTSYPYTVEVAYEVVYDGLLFYPSWYGQGGDRVGVEQASFKVQAPKGMFRYKTAKVKEPVIKNADNGELLYTWEIAGLPPFEWEDYGPPFEEIVPNVQTAPAKFEIEGYRGDLSTWNGLGQWQNLLMKDLEALPEETVKKIKKLTADAPSDEEKVRRVYQYLQENTRYVSIQLGIGGWKPFSPAFVDKNGYGDCKALTYYTKAMLANIGIPSHYTLVQAGEDEENIDKDFPSRQFNHAFLCVPNAGDTLWLECTSQTNPFGYLGTFTGDRDVLLVTENGGKIVHTPAYGMEQNRQVRRADVYLQKDGHAKAEVTTAYEGIQYENRGLNFILNEGKEEQKKWLQKNIDIPNFELPGFTLTNHGGKVPKAEVAVQLDLRKYASVSGKRVFFMPNLMNRLGSQLPKKSATRKTDLILKTPFMDVDTIVYHLPEGIHVEYLPEPVEVQSDFGTYKAKVTVTEGKATYVREFKMKKGRYPATAYKDLADFFKKIVKADKTKMVFLTST